MSPVLPSAHDDASPSITSRGRSPLTFVVLVFALALPFWLIGAVTGIQPTPDLPVSALQFVSPVIAASLLVYREKGAAGVAALLKRSFDYPRIRAMIWYVPAVLLLPGIYTATYGVMRLLGVPLPAVQLPVIVALGWFLGYFIAGQCEELGWSGYALDPLQARSSALGASLLLGTIWAAFHLVPHVQGHRSPEWIAWWALATVALRVLYTWLYNNTAGSVFATVVFHATGNLAQIGPFLDFGPGGYPLEAQRIAALLLMVVAAVVMVMWGPQTLARYRSQSHLDIAPSFGRIPTEGPRC